MEALQKQISELDQKVDLLHQVVERLSTQISELITIKSEVENPQPEAISKPSVKLSSELVNPQVENISKHKDILDDNTRVKSYQESNYDLGMSPDTQIRRLTAQLTAAYNRIAALEEQLLASRAQI